MLTPVERRADRRNEKNPPCRRCQGCRCPWSGRRRAWRRTCASLARPAMKRVVTSCVRTAEARTVPDLQLRADKRNQGTRRRRDERTKKPALKRKRSVRKESIAARATERRCCGRCAPIRPRRVANVLVGLVELQQHPTSRSPRRVSRQTRMGWTAMNHDTTDGSQARRRGTADDEADAEGGADQAEVLLSAPTALRQHPLWRQATNRFGNPIERARETKWDVAQRPSAGIPNVPSSDSARENQLRP